MIFKIVTAEKNLRKKCATHHDAGRETEVWMGKNEYKEGMLTRLSLLVFICMLLYEGLNGDV